MDVSGTRPRDAGALFGSTNQSWRAVGPAAGPKNPKIEHANPLAVFLG